MRPLKLLKTIQFKHLFNSSQFKSVKLTLVILCIIFSGKNVVHAQNNGYKPTYDKVFYGGMLVFSATDLYLTQKLNAVPHHWEIYPIDKLALNQLNLNYIQYFYTQYSPRVFAALTFSYADFAFSA